MADNREFIELVTVISGDEKIKKVDNEISKLGNTANASGEKIDNLGNKIENTGNSSTSAKSQLSGLTYQIKNLNSNSQDAKNGYSDLMETIKRYAGMTALVVGTKRAISTYTAFDDEMKKVQATAGATVVQMEQLRNQAKDLGRTTTWSASEVASAQFEFAKAGFEAGDILKATSGILNTATAGQLDLAEATEITAGALRMFDLNASDSIRVGDILAKTSNISSTDIRGLGESLKYAGLDAKNFKLSLEETTALLAAMGDMKLDGSMAGTGLRAVFSALRNKSKAEILVDAGINLTQNGEYRSFLDILTDIRKQTSQMERAQAESFLGQVFGDQGGLAMLALLGTSEEKMNSLLTSLKETEGYSNQVAETFNAGIGGSFRNFRSAIEGVSISFSEILAPSITTVTNSLTYAINGITTFLEWLNSGSTIANILMFAITGITTVLITYKGVMMAATVTSFLLAKASGILAVVKGTLAAAYGIASLAGGGFAGVLGLINVLMVPTIGFIGAAVGVVLGLGAGFVFLYKKSETFRNGVNALIEKIKSLIGWISKIPGVKQVVGVGKKIIGGVKDFFFGDEEDKNTNINDTVKTESSKQKAINTPPGYIGQNTDYLITGAGGKTYKHNGYYLKGTSLVNNNENSITNNSTNSTGIENNYVTQEKTTEDKILDVLYSIKELLNKNNKNGNTVQINVSKMDKEDIISQVVEDLAIALDNI